MANLNTVAIVAFLLSQGPAAAAIKVSGMQEQVDLSVSSPATGRTQAPNQCELPEGSKWCTVRLAHTSFEMAVYDHADIVSNGICRYGHWEFKDTAIYGPPGSFVDIGGNIGYYTFSLAKAGWTVHTFEPMPENLALIKASLCKNPDVVARVHLNEIGLGPEKTQCHILSDKNNHGDGRTVCGKIELDENNVVRATINVDVLDDVLRQSDVKVIDFVKIDVEGYECQVFKGGRSVLSHYKPRLIQSEVDEHQLRPNGCSSTGYLRQFEEAGYKVSKDVRCETADSYKGRPQDFYMCRLD